MDLFSLLRNNLSPEKKIAQAISSKDITLLEEVFQSGFPINARIYQQGGDTALHLACSSDNYDHSVVSKLIEYQADPSVTNDFDRIPLHRAIYCKSTELVKLLLETDSSHSCIDKFWNILPVNIDSFILAIILIATPNFSKYDSNIRHGILDFAIRSHFYTCIKLLILSGEHLHERQLSQYLEGDEETDLKQWIQYNQRNVPTLQHFCRMVLRQSFDNKHNVIYGVERLNLPKSLKQFIKFSDVTPLGL